MNQEYTKFLTSILKDMAVTDHIRPADIPDIDLYMDQVTHFMDDHLQRYKRYEDDKILTKTMINNYAKNKLLPPPVKKRYSREHMLVLIFIYYYKGFLSLHDIQSILNPITDRFFSSDENANPDFNIEDVYEEIYALSRDHIRETAKSIMGDWHTASNTFKECPEEDQEFLQLFSFICLLGFDIYLKKDIIERMIDHLTEIQTRQDPKSKEKNKNKNKEKGTEK